MGLLNRYTKLVFLGDSNSDNGNVFRMTSQTYPPPNVYHEGRYSNGRIWADHLEQLSGTPSINLAHGYATIDNSIVAGTVPMPSGQRQEVPSVLDQIDQLHSLVGKLGPDELVFVQVGSNDLNSLVETDSTYNVKSEFTPQLLASRLRVAIERLCNDCDARNIVVLNVRPRVYQPDVIALSDTEKKDFTRRVNAQLNDAYESEVSLLQEKLGDGCMLAVFDTHGFQKRISENPAAYGIDADTETPCYVEPPASGIQGPKPCFKNSDTKLFFDSSHLGKRAQALLAAEVVKQLTLWLLLKQ
ncbi:hypothetical protein GQ54DRAFT_117599 [Martensiomyces pterosporus]|nr:hypothetical protein GQ54DRAFT_117599 [Martensiomyces pterosporus]